ncbi:MAG TPA: hypothetical protein VMV92_08725 [Streptosporangiaceae bacterium]|nr:hypothetical protein [Streptosporangiaceae bacterium]
MISGQVLSVRGDRIVDGDGHPAALRGYNVGGWMNMENFLTGYPGSTQTTLATLASLGMNSVAS